MDKIEFFGNFTRNVFCAFSVTLLARPKKRHVGDHVCFASPSCDDQSFAGRKVVLIGFFDNLRRRFLITSHRAPPHAPLKPKNCNGWLVHAPGANTTERSCGDEVATHWLPSSLARTSPVSHAGSEGSNSSAASPPSLHTCSPSPPRDAETPRSTASRVGTVAPYNIENDANQLISKNTKISNVSQFNVSNL